MMPNHITNQITFGSDEKALEAFREMLEFVKEKDGLPGSMDFNKLIPMPEELNISAGSETNEGLKIYGDFVEVYKLNGKKSKEELLNIPQNSEEIFLRIRRDIDESTWELGKAAFKNVLKYGYPTWYEWSINNWGTKWNAYDCRPVGKDTDTMEFNTAWSDVRNIARLLSVKFPDSELTYRWADEDIGFNVGEIVYKNGEISGQDIPIGGSKEAYEMAAAIKGIDLAKYNLYLSKDGAAYEYREDVIEPPAREVSKTKKKSRDISR